MTTKLTTETPLGTSLSSLVQGFALTKRTEGKSTRTVDYYRDNLKRFVWYAEAHGWSDDITLITAWHVREFLGYVATEKRRWKTSSRSGWHSGCKASLATLHHYFVFLSTFFHLINTNPLPLSMTSAMLLSSFAFSSWLRKARRAAVPEGPLLVYAANFVHPD